MALQVCREAGAAEAALAEAQRLAPDNIDIAIRRAEAAIAGGNTELELSRLEHSARADSRQCGAAGGARITEANAAGGRPEAIDLLETATVLAPDHPTPHGLLAQALVRANRVGEALPALDRAIELAPDDVTLRNNRAAALIRVHRHREARDVLEALVAGHGEHSGLLCNLSNALVSLGQQDAGAEVARRAIARDPGLNLAWRTLCNALPYCDGIGGAELLAVLRRAGTVLPRRPPVAWRQTADPERQLRVGLLSPALKTHPVGWLTIAGFENLDPAAFAPAWPGAALSDRCHPATVRGDRGGLGCARRTAGRCRGRSHPRTGAGRHHRSRRLWRPGPDGAMRASAGAGAG